MAVGNMDASKTGESFYLYEDGDAYDGPFLNGKQEGIGYVI